MLLDVHALKVSYGRKTILHDLSFSAQAHQLIGIMGENGCGKTTLLKALCGILPSDGGIQICDRSMRSLSPRQLAGLCRYMPQRCGITIDLSAEDVVLMGFNPQLRLLEHPRTGMKLAAEEALSQVGLSSRCAMNFQQFSEGHKQLCILARTLLPEHGVLLLDEPESALDFSGRYRALSLLRQWVNNHEGCAVVTLHDLQLALNTCDTLLLMRRGTFSAVLHPQTDSLQTLEENLSAVFGHLSVHRVRNQKGQEQLVLLKEE